MAITTPNVNPLVMKDVDVILGGVDGVNVKKHLSSATFTPSASAQTWVGLGGNSHTDSGTSTWALDCEYVQDWETVDSFSQYLLEHEGEVVPATFKPRTGSGPSFTSSVTITPGAIGGQANAFATSSVSLGSTKPVLVPAV